MSTLEKILNDIHGYETEMEEYGVSALCPVWVKKIIEKHLSAEDDKVKKILEYVQERKSVHEKDYDDFNDCDAYVDVQIRIAERIDELAVVEKFIKELMRKNETDGT